MRRLVQYLRWPLRIVGGLLGLLVVALLVGTIYQAVVGDVDETRYKPPGRLLDIGGR